MSCKNIAHLYIWHLNRPLLFRLLLLGSLLFIFCCFLCLFCLLFHSGLHLWFCLRPHIGFDYTNLFLLLYLTIAMLYIFQWLNLILRFLFVLLWLWFIIFLIQISIIFYLVHSFPFTNLGIKIFINMLMEWVNKGSLGIDTKIMSFNYFFWGPLIENGGHCFILNVL